MSQLSPETLQTIATVCRGNSANIAESFNVCFDTLYRMLFDEPQTWDLEQADPRMNGPGQLVIFRFGEEGILVLIPATVPLPDWYRKPDLSQKSRLETLPMEWSYSLLPEDLPADGFNSVFAENLQAAAGFSDPAEGALFIPVRLVDDAHMPAEASDNSLPTIWILGPVNAVPVDLPEDPPPPAPAASGPSGTAGSSAATGPTGEKPPPPANLRNMQHLMRTPVKILVTLAERKLPVEQLAALGPGSIILFEKSCEDLLDLYVNNRVYCRGEAIKIGEKFGLKISELGPGPDPDAKRRGQVLQT